MGARRKSCDYGIGEWLVPVPTMTFSHLSFETETEIHNTPFPPTTRTGRYTSDTMGNAPSCSLCLEGR